MSAPLCLVSDLGLIDYQPAWDLQRHLVEQRRANAVPDRLLLVEHPHTFTLGRAARHEHLLAAPETLQRVGARVFEVDRGGDITYHGPGQLVGYPILDLRAWQSDVRLYLRRLEEVLIRTLAWFGVHAGRENGLTGVWVGNEKVAAIGVKVAHFVTSHGLALNVNPDLSYFEHIVPCGISDRGVTSLARLLGQPVEMARVTDRVVDEFGTVFGLRMVHDTSALFDGSLRMAGAGGRSPIQQGR